MAAILDLRIMYISKYFCNVLNRCVAPENMGIETKIESLTSLVFILWLVYRFPIMATNVYGGHIGFKGHPNSKKCFK
jgi:hypothetical protein